MGETKRGSYPRIDVRVPEQMVQEIEALGVELVNAAGKALGKPDVQRTIIMAGLLSLRTFPEGSAPRLGVQRAALIAAGLIAPGEPVPAGGVARDGWCVVSPKGEVTSSGHKSADVAREHLSPHGPAEGWTILHSSELRAKPSVSVDTKRLKKKGGR